MAQHIRTNIGNTAVSADIYRWGNGQTHICYYLEAKPRYSDADAPQREAETLAGVLVSASAFESVSRSTAALAEMIKNGDDGGVPDDLLA